MSKSKPKKNPAPKFSQKKLNRLAKKTRSEWLKLVKESGMPEKVFMNSGNEANRFMGQYALMQEQVRAEGYDMPNLIEGVNTVLVDKKE